MRFISAAVAALNCALASPAGAQVAPLPAQPTEPAAAPVSAAPSSEPAPAPMSAAPPSSLPPAASTPTPPGEAPLAPTTEAARASAPAATRDDSAAFEVARTQLLNGQFAEAAAAFRALEGQALDPAQARLCATLARLAETWEKRGLTLVLRSDMGESDFSAKAVDRRSSGEIATLYGGAALYGLGTGAFVSILAEPEGIAGITVPLIAFGLIMPGSVYLFDRTAEVRYGTPAAMTNGMTVGLLEGGLWTAWYQAQANYDDEVSGKASAALVWVPTTLGAIAGGALGQGLGTTPGRAELIGAGGMFGALISGLVVASVAAPGYENDDSWLLGAAIGTNVGAVSGYLLGAEYSPSVSRVRYIQLGGLGGGLLTGLVFFTAAEDGKLFDAEPMGAVVALGTAAGLGLATWATSDMPRDERREEPEDASAQLYLSPTPGGGLSVGAAGGF